MRKGKEKKPWSSVLVTVWEEVEKINKKKKKRFIQEYRLNNYPVEFKKEEIQKEKWMITAIEEKKTNDQFGAKSPAWLIDREWYFKGWQFFRSGNEANKKLYKPNGSGKTIKKVPIIPDANYLNIRFNKERLSFISGAAAAELVKFIEDYSPAATVRKTLAPTLSNNTPHAEISDSPEYKFFYRELCQPGYIDEEDFKEWIKLILTKSSSSDKIPFLKAHKKIQIMSIFYTWYVQNGRPQKEAQIYAGYLGNHFEGFETKNVRSNWATSHPPLKKQGKALDARS